MKTNIKKIESPVTTEEGGRAVNVNPYFQLRRSVMSTMLFEDGCYENGESVADRISNLVGVVAKKYPERLAELVIEARTNFKLRHIPLFLTREMARHKEALPYLADTLYNVIQRADELGEFLNLWNIKGKQPLAKQAYIGLRRAFTKFDEFALSRYSGGKSNYSLRDVLFVIHAKPTDKAQEKLWKKLIDNKLESVDSWEVALTNAHTLEDKKNEWTRLLKENKLGALALLRNLNNFKSCGVEEEYIIGALENMKVDRVLPFRFIAAARYYPSLEPQLEQAMFKCIEDIKKLDGRTLILNDISGSMDMHKISAKSDMTRTEAACALSILAREVYKNVKVFTFSSNITEVPNRRGFALRDAIVDSQPHKSTRLGKAMHHLNNNQKFDRLIILTDEQSEDTVPPPNCERAYMINVANNKHGVGYKKTGYIHIDGMSESVLSYIQMIESEKE